MNNNWRKPEEKSEFIGIFEVNIKFKNDVKFKALSASSAKVMIVNSNLEELLKIDKIREICKEINMDVKIEWKIEEKKDYVNTLFHRLWTKSVDTEDYNKEEWKKLRDELNSLGVMV